MSIREGPEELTLRAEEVGSQKLCTNADHIAQDRWGPPLVHADWRAFCQAICKCSEVRDWEELHKRAASVKKPNENPKAKALWKMKAAKDREEEFCDPGRKDNILGRNETRLEQWERAPQRPDCGTG